MTSLKIIKPMKNLLLILLLTIMIQLVGQNSAINIIENPESLFDEGVLNSQNYDIIFYNKVSSDTKQRLDSIYTADTIPGFYISTKTTHFVYDTNGKIIQRLRRFSPSPDKNKVEYLYDINDRINRKLYYQWNVSTNTWDSIWDVYLTYEDGFLIQDSSYHWTDGEWILASEYIYKYNSNNNLTLKELFVKDIDNQWVIYSKDTTIYDIEENIIETNYSIWKNNIEEWKIIKKIEFEYNEGNLIQSLIYQISNNNLEVDSKTIYQYNFLFTNENLLLPYYYTIGWQNMRTSSIEYELVDGDWQYSSEESFHYSEIEYNGISKQNRPTLTLFPNPAKEKIKIQLDNNNKQQVLFILSNTFGQTLINRKIKVNEWIDISILKKGLYTYTIRSQKKVFYGKILKL